MSTKASTTRTTKTKKIVKVEPEPEPVVAPTPEPVVEATAPTSEENATPETEVESLKQRFERFIKSRQEAISEIKLEIQELRKMQREHELALKEAQKKNKKKKVPRDDITPRKPSGFASPVVVSDAMYDFLQQFGVKRGDPIARTDVTRHITGYIKQHDLQNPEHRRQIVPDEALRKLFSAPEELKDPNDPNSEKIWSYLRLQKYLSSHFPSRKTQN